MADKPQLLIWTWRCKNCLEENRQSVTGPLQKGSEARRVACPWCGMEDVRILLPWRLEPDDRDAPAGAPAEAKAEEMDDSRRIWLWRCGVCRSVNGSRAAVGTKGGKSFRVICKQCGRVQTRTVHPLSLSVERRQDEHCKRT